MADLVEATRRVDAGGELWDAELIRRQREGTLVRIAAEGRLLRMTPQGARRLALAWVDQAALALVDAALARNRSVNLLYPAPAGDVAVLLAAQLLIRAFVRRQPEPSVGLVTADPTRAAQIWEELRIESVGDRVPLTDVFPYWRASPDGSAAFNGLLRGVVIGRRCDNWLVDVTVVDSLAGPVTAETRGPLVRVFADPLDPSLRDVGQAELVWGWSEAVLARWHERPAPAGAVPKVPFSVAQERLRTLAQSPALLIVRCPGDEAAEALARARSTLVRLADAAGPAPTRHLLAGLRVAWGHLATLSALPSRPSEYDRHAGIPPRAARRTDTFEHEIAAWAKTLPREQGELAAEVATEIGLLRTALEVGSPLKSAIAAAVNEGRSGLVVVRTRTAAKALASALGGDVAGLRIGPLRVTWFGELHKEATTSLAMVLGAPPRSGWHRVVSGLARELRLLVLGEDEVRRTRLAWDSLRTARAYWSSQRLRARVWRELLGEDPPPPYPEDAPPSPDVAIAAGPALPAEIDPFSPLGPLFRDDHMLLAEEGPSEEVAEVTPRGEYQTRVAAVEAETDQGFVLLPRDGEVEVVLGDTVDAILGSALRPGMRLIVPREGGRLNLLAALEDRLRDRPDLLAARLLIEEYQSRVYGGFRAFQGTGLDVADLYDRIRRHGCKKVLGTVRAWVTRGGPMGPRDVEDLRHLNVVLRLGYTPARVVEIHAGLECVRVFRRVAALAIVRAATSALLAAEDSRVNPDMGISVADLREAVAMVTVKTIRPFARLANVTEIGRLQPECFA